MRKKVWNLEFKNALKHGGIETHKRLKEVIAAHRKKGHIIKSIKYIEIEYLPI